MKETRHGKRGELASKISIQISPAQREKLDEAAKQQRVKVSDIVRWLIDDHVDDYLTPRSAPQSTDRR